jgi:hypothetical protein
MMVPAAVFTCSICGEVSSNICAYCTKDACSNHRCERCKRCSDCCECEYPLSAEEAVALPVQEVPGAVLDAELADAELADPEAESLPLEAPEEQAPARTHAFLTPEESSVFAEERGVREPRIHGESNVFAEEDEDEGVGEEDELSDLPEDEDLAEPNE